MVYFAEKTDLNYYWAPKILIYDVYYNDCILTYRIIVVHRQQQ